VQFLGRRGQAAAAGDFEESACQFDVHEAPGDEWAPIVVECDQELWEGGLLPIAVCQLTDRVLAH
jgi:hypothetical protein